MDTDFESATLTVGFIVLFIPDVILNSLLCLAILRTRSLQTPINYLIGNLAFCDILIGIFIFPRHIINHTFDHPQGVLGDYLCKFLTGGGFLWISVTSSGFFLTVIAFERYFTVEYPHSLRLRITNKKVYRIVIAVWVISIVANCPSSLVLKYDTKDHFCLEDWPEWVSPKAYVAVMFIMGNSSVLFMYMLYSRILYKFWKKKRNVTEISQAARLRVRTQVTKMLVVMTVVHTFCRAPNYSFYLLSYVEPSFKYGSNVYSFTVLLILLNSTSHPFLLCWQIRTLRLGVKRILKNFLCIKAFRKVVFTRVYGVDMSYSYR